MGYDQRPGGRPWPSGQQPGPGWQPEQGPGQGWNQGRGGDQRWRPPQWRPPQSDGSRGNDPYWQGHEQEPSGEWQPATQGYPPQPPYGAYGRQPVDGRPLGPAHGRPWVARHKALTGALGAAGLIIIIAAASSVGSPGGRTAAGMTISPSAGPQGARVTLASLSPAAGQGGVTGQGGAAAQAAARHPAATTAPSVTLTKQPQPVKAHDGAPAGPTSAASLAATQAPPPPPPPSASAAPPSASAVPPSASAAPASCYPLTNGGKCYQPGEACRTVDHGTSGLAGDGEPITCEDNNGWRWEPS